MLLACHIISFAKPVNAHKHINT
ncbi:hypothetical protein CP01DC11_1341A, partial [Chlamydia psittaci 01DC11]